MLISSSKIILKNFKYKKIAVLFLTTQTMLLGLMFGMLSTIVHSFTTYEAKMENATKSMFLLSLSPDGTEAQAMNELSKRHNFSYEGIAAKYFQTRTNVATQDINVYARTRHKVFSLDELVSGMFPRTNEEVAIGSGFAKKNNIQLGHTLELGDNKYTVVGLYQHPNEYQLYDLTKSSDLSLEHNLPLIVTNLATIADDTEAAITYYAKIEDGQTKDILMAEQVLSVKEMKLDILQSLVRTNTQILYVSCLLMLCIIMIAIFLQVKGLINSHIASFGVLISMGVQKVYIILSYAVIPLYIGGFLLLGWECGKHVTNGYFLQVETTYNMVIAQEPISFLLQIIYIGSICLFIAMATFIYVGYRLRASPLMMIASEGIAQKYNIFVQTISLKRLPFAWRMQIKNMIGNALTTMLITISIFFAIFLFQFSFSLDSASMALITDYGTFINFEAKSYYDMKAGDSEQERFIETKVKMIENISAQRPLATSRSLQAIDITYQALNFINEVGESVTHLAKNELIIPRKFAESYNIKRGDRLILSLEGEMIEVNVSFINDVYVDEYLYTSKETVRDIFVQRYGTLLTNGQFTKTEDANFVIEKKQLLAAGRQMTDSIRPVIALLLGFSLILFFTTLILFSNFIVQKHNKEITLLIAEGRSALAAVRIFVHYFNFLIVSAGVLVLCCNDQMLAYLSRLVSDAVGYKLVFLADMSLVCVLTFVGLLLYNVYLSFYYNGNKVKNLERVLKMEE